MNILNAHLTTSPHGTSEECARFVIDDVANRFVLTGIASTGETYTFSCWIRSEAEGFLMVGDEGISTSPEWERYISIFTVRSKEVRLEFGAVGTYDIYHAQLELGTIATDWTPAPEDVDDTISDISTELRETIVEQTTNAVSTCEEIMLSALESYVETGNYTEFRESVESQFSVLADQINLVFTNTNEAIQAVDGDLQSKFQQITTFFTFDIDGFTIGKEDSPYKIFMTNERYSMQVNGVEVLWIDAVTKAAYFPSMTITERFTIIGYVITMDENGNLNCDWGGEE